MERSKLLRISFKIGVGDSVRYLRKQHGIAGRFAASTRYAPDDLVRSLVPYVGDADHGIRGFHLNTFNQVETTERWWRRMLASFDYEEAWEGRQ